MPKNERNNKQDVAIAVIQESVRALRVEVDKILDNHLPHIQQRLDGIERKLAWYAGAIVVIGFIIQIVVARFI